MKGDSIIKILLLATTISLAMVTLPTEGWGQTITVILNARKAEKKLVIEVDRTAKITDFRKLVGEKGFDSLNLFYSKRPSSPLNDDSTLTDYNVQNNDVFFTEPKVVVDPMLVKMKEFYDAASDARDQGQVVTDLLRAIKADQRLKFIADYKNEGDLDKISLHRAAREGNIEVLKAIKALLTDDEFKGLMAIPDREGRTVLMFAAQARKKAAETIELVLDHTPKDFLRAKDKNHGKLTAFDWALARLEDGMNEELMEKLFEATGSHQVDSLDFSKVCPEDKSQVVLDTDREEFLATIKELKKQIVRTFR